MCIRASGAEGKKLPDLFDPELAGVPAAARVYTGVQYAGACSSLGWMVSPIKYVWCRGHYVQPI